MVIGINLPQHGQLIPGTCDDLPPETAFSSSSVRMYSFVSLFLLSMFVWPFFILNICFVIRQSRRNFSGVVVFPEEAFGRINSESVARKCQRYCATTAVAEFKIAATAALAVVFFQRSERCTDFFKIFSARKEIFQRRFFDIAEKKSVLFIIAGHLMARIKISVRRHGDHSAIAFAHRCACSILSFAGVHCGKGIKFCFRIKRSELPYGQIHIMSFRCVLLPERNRFVKIFFKGKAGVAGVLNPTRSLGRADYPHFVYAHSVEFFAVSSIASQFRRFIFVCTLTGNPFSIQREIASSAVCSAPL